MSDTYISKMIKAVKDGDIAKAQKYLQKEIELAEQGIVANKVDNKGNLYYSHKGDKEDDFPYNGC
jgi:hypothetical protein